MTTVLYFEPHLAEFETYEEAQKFIDSLTYDTEIRLWGEGHPRDLDKAVEIHLKNINEIL